jgi:SprT protein
VLKHSMCSNYICNKMTNQNAPTPQELFAQQLKQYVPIASMPFILKCFAPYNIRLILKPKRRTVLGTYQAPLSQTDWHKITINNDLNQYAFLFTLVHEIAHMHTWARYCQNCHKDPHGEEWQNIFRSLLNEVIDYFPSDIALAIQTHIQSVRAATCRDEKLYKLLKQYDLNPSFLLEDLEVGGFFTVEGFQGMRFQKIKKLRKYYHCNETNTQCIYKISGLQPIILV